MPFPYLLQMLRDLHPKLFNKVILYNLYGSRHKRYKAVARKVIWRPPEELRGSVKNN